MTTAVQPATQVGRTTEGGVVGFVRGHPVGAFLAWFFTIGQAIAFVPLVAEAFADVELPTEPFLLTATAVGLVLPAVVITWLMDGPEGLRALRRRTLTFGVPVRWYGLAVVGVPVAMVAATAAGFGAPEQTTGSALGAALGSGFLLQLVVVFVTFNLWEELAWMGFVQVKLQARHGPIKASVLTGVVFALGHISQVIEGSASETLVLVALLLVVCMPFRALQAWIYNRTGSIALVGLVHAAANATAAGSILGPGLLDRLYPDAGAGGLVFPVLGALGLVVIAGTRGRLGYRRETPEPTQAGPGHVPSHVHLHRRRVDLPPSTGEVLR